MATRNDELVIGIFDHRTQAERAIMELWNAGFAHDRIDMVTRDGATSGTPNLHLQNEAGNSAITGALGGASAGAVAGAVAVTLVPGIGTVLGGGLLAAMLGGAALGAAGGTFLGPFIALEMSEDDAHYYAHHLDEGRTLVVVKSHDRLLEAQAILRKAGARERVPNPV
jgi:outer membrane lipoprotein SlyB